MENEKTPTCHSEGINLEAVRPDKDIKIRGQLQIVYNEFLSHPGTMLEISTRTGILRQSICGIVAKLRKQDRIFFIERGRCSISYHKAGFYTTDLQFFTRTKKADNE